MSNNPRERLELATLRAENRYLRKVVRDTPDGRILRRTYQDARQFLVWRFSGLSISRSACAEMGISRRRWQWARAALMLARVHDGHDVIIHDFDDALSQLTAAMEQLERNGLDALRHKLPFSSRRKGPRPVSQVGTESGTLSGSPQGHTHAQNVPTSRDNEANRGEAGRGVRDRRAEIEARMGVD